MVISTRIRPVFSRFIDNLRSLTRKTSGETTETINSITKEIWQKLSLIAFRSPYCIPLAIHSFNLFFVPNLRVTQSREQNARSMGRRERKLRATLFPNTHCAYSLVYSLGNNCNRFSGSKPRRNKHIHSPELLRKKKEERTNSRLKSQLQPLYNVLNFQTARLWDSN